MKKIEKSILSRTNNSIKSENDSKNKSNENILNIDENIAASVLVIKSNDQLIDLIAENRDQKPNIKLELNECKEKGG